MKPNIHVLSLGGTIAMAKGAAGVVPRLSAEELVGAVPQLANFANVRAESWRAIPGAHLDFDTLIALADKIRDLSARAVSGVVITQGTDTIEEAAFALDLMLDIALPVVVTGAMRNPTRPGADGPANMLAAVQVAASNAARRLGVVVVLNDEIHAARFVQKAHTSSLSTFRSDPLGPIGWLSEDQVRIALCPARRPAITPAPGQARAKVAILKMALGDDGTLVEAALGAGFDGLVVEAMGGGHVSPKATRALADAASHIPVILASRAGSGEALRSTYGFEGAEIDLLSKGLISAGRLNGVQARVLLTLLLCANVRDKAGLARHFEAETPA